MLSLYHPYGGPEAHQKAAAEHRGQVPPAQGKRYIVTDQCFWEQHPPKDYNPLDAKRTPHHITLVDAVTGSIVMLKSGSIVQVIEAQE